MGEDLTKLSKEELIDKINILYYNMNIDTNRIEQLEAKNKDLQESVDQIYDDYQDIGKMYFELDEKVQKLIEKLEKDIENDYRIKEYMGDSYCITGAKEIPTRKYAQEILSILKGEKE